MLTTQNINNTFSYFYAIKEWAVEKLYIPTHLFDWTPKIFEILKSGQNRTCYRISLVNRSFFIIPKIEKIHFISNPETIKKIISLGRNGEELGLGISFQQSIEPITGIHNLIFCSKSNHNRLRGPLELPLKNQTLKQLSREIALEGINTLHSLNVHGFSPETFAAFVVINSLIGEHPVATAKIYTQILDIRSGIVDCKEKLATIFKTIYAQRMYSENTIFDYLQKAEDKEIITEAEKLSNLAAMLVGGVHTTSSFLSFFITVFLKNSELREKIIEEWDQFKTDFNIHLSNKNSLIEAIILFSTGGELEGNKYLGSKTLKNCYYEMLRFYPIFPDIKRFAKKDFTIDGVSFAKNDEVSLNLLAYQKNQAIWGNDAQKFNPGRFADPELKNKLYVFSFGPQSCIGKNLLERESLIFMAELLIFYTWKIEDDNVKPKYNLEPTYDGFNLIPNCTYFSENEFTVKKEINDILNLN